MPKKESFLAFAQDASCYKEQQKILAPRFKAANKVSIMKQNEKHRFTHIKIH